MPGIHEFCFERHPLVVELRSLPAAFPGPWKLSSDCTFLLGCRRIEQFYGTLRSILAPDHFCLFCHPELMKAQPLFCEGGWLVKHNDYPYDHHEHHFVLFPKRHIKYGWELSDEDYVDRGRIERRLAKEFGFDGCVSVMRQGDARRTVATIPHIHGHVQVPDGLGPAVAYFGKTLEHQAMDFVQLKIHVAELESRGGLDWLLNPATKI